MWEDEVLVTARRWVHGWELILGENDATQVRTLAHAESQVRDYLDTIDPDVDHSNVKVFLVPEEGAEEIRLAQEARVEAEQAAARAAEQIRDVVTNLRTVRGYSLSDTAELLGVTRARVSQLERSAKAKADA